MVVLEDMESYYEIRSIFMTPNRGIEIKLKAFDPHNSIRNYNVGEPMALITAERYKELWEAEAEYKMLKKLLR